MTFLLIIVGALLVLWFVCVLTDGKRRERSQTIEKIVLLTSLLVATPSLAGDRQTGGPADRWTSVDTAMEATWQVLHAVEMGQTLDLARQPERYYEAYNPLLGKHPSTERVYVWGVTSSLAHAGISFLLPSKVDLWGMKVPVRTIFQAVSIGWTGSMVGHNFDIGLKVRF